MTVPDPQPTDAMTPPLTPAGQALARHESIMDGVSFILDNARRKGLLSEPEESVFLTELDLALDELEAQAATRALAELRREVEGLADASTASPRTPATLVGHISRRAVLALIDKASKPKEDQ